MDAILSESFDDGNSEKRRNAHEVNGIEKHILTGINVEKTDDVFTEGTIDSDKVVNDRVDTAANVSGEVNKERIHEKPEEDEAAVDGLNNCNASNGDGGEHVNNLEKASDVDGTFVKELRADKQENCEETAEAKTSVKVNKKRNKIRKKKALRIDEILSESFDDGNQEKGQNAYEVDDIEKNIASEINVARTKNVFAQGTVDDDKVVNDRGEAAGNISGEGNEERINGKLEEDALVKGLDNNNAITGDEREHVNNVEKASNADDTLECKEDKHEIGEETAEVKISVKVKKKRNSKKKALQILSGVATINNGQKLEAGIDELASKEPIRIDTLIGIDQMSVEKASNVDDALVKECKEDKHENGEEIAVVETSVKLNKKRKRNRENKALEILSGVATMNNAQKPETGIDESASKEPIRIDTPIGIDKTSVEKASNADGTLVKECNEDKPENGEVTAEVKKRNKIKKKKALQILSGVATINNAQKPETSIDELASKEPIGIDTLGKNKDIPIVSGVATVEDAQKPGSGNDELASKEPIEIDKPAVKHEYVPKGANKSNSSNLSTKKRKKSNSSNLSTKKRKKSNSSKDGKLSEKNDCTGMIFLCNSDTKRDCHLYRVIGMPFHMKDLVTKGMRLFLFDVDLRMMYGIYWASGPGRFNIEPRSFNVQFPCQVRYHYVINCKPLAEELFREVLKEFHYTPTDYIFPLNPEQVANLCKLFVENTKAPITISPAKAASGNKVAAAASSSAQLDRKREREKDSNLEQKRSRLTYGPPARLYAEYYRAAENHPPAHLYRS